MHANLLKDCKAELATLQVNARDFINDFQATHDLSRDIVAKIAAMCVALFAGEYSYLTKDYSTDLSSAKTAVNLFLVGWPTPSKQYSTLFDNLEAACNVLLQKATDFYGNNTLTPSKYAKKGCETNLNSLRTELSTFLSGLTPAKNTVVGLIKQIRPVIADLNKLVDQFAAANDLSPANTKGNYCKLKLAINEFFTKFNGIHWVGHKEFIDIQAICDAVTAGVRELFIKYN